MNHDIRPGRLRQYGTTALMHVESQRKLKRRLPNMHGQHPEPAKGPCIILEKVPGLLLGNDGRAGATPLS